MKQRANIEISLEDHLRMAKSLAVIHTHVDLLFDDLYKFYLVAGVERYLAISNQSFRSKFADLRMELEDSYLFGEGAGPYVKPGIPPGCDDIFQKESHRRALAEHIVGLPENKEKKNVGGKEL